MTINILTSWVPPPTFAPADLITGGNTHTYTVNYRYYPTIPLTWVPVDFSAPTEDVLVVDAEEDELIVEELYVLD